MDKKEAILLKVANDHSYDTWGDAMYDTHEHSQIEYAYEAMESYSASLQKENEELKATIIKGEKYLETVSEQLGAAIEDYNKEKDLCREQQRTIDELREALISVKEDSGFGWLHSNVREKVESLNN